MRVLLWVPGGARIAIRTMHENDIGLPTGVLTACNFEELWRIFHGVLLMHRGSQQGTFMTHRSGNF